MYICPDCHEPVEDPGSACGACHWRPEHRDGIPFLLSSEDRDDPLFIDYVENYDQIAADDLHEAIMEQGYAQAQARKLAGYLGPLTGLRVADLGIGRGLLFDDLVRSGAGSVVGVDISATYLRRYLTMPRVRVVGANAENLPFASDFDVLVASDILEHVINIGDCLVSINRALRTGGRFVVRVPYDENLIHYATSLGALYRFAHLRSFTRHGLGDLLSSAGFAVQRIELDGFATYQARRYLQRLPKGPGVTGRILRAAFGHVAATPNAVGRLFMRPIELVMVATKVRAIPESPRARRRSAVVG